MRIELGAVAEYGKAQCIGRTLSPHHSFLFSLFNMKCHLLARRLAIGRTRRECNQGGIRSSEFSCGNKTKATSNNQKRPVSSAISASVIFLRDLPEDLMEAWVVSRLLLAVRFATIRVRRDSGRHHQVALQVQSSS